MKRKFLGLVLIAILAVGAMSSGVVLAANEHIGVYAGGHETAGMGGAVTYRYSVELKADDTYELKSYFIMGDTLYEFIETGAYSVDGTKVVITPAAQEPIEGSLNSDGTLTIAVKPSQMASKRTESTLVPSNNPVAGVYKGTLQGAVAVDVTLYLTHNNQYFYIAKPANDSAAVHENGTYAVNGAEFSFKVADSDVAFAGKVEDGKLSAPFVVSAMMGMRMEISLEK